MGGRRRDGKSGEGRTAVLCQVVNKQVPIPLAVHSAEVPVPVQVPMVKVPVQVPVPNLQVPVPVPVVQIPVQVPVLCRLSVLGYKAQSKSCFFLLPSLKKEFEQGRR